MVNESDKPILDFSLSYDKTYLAVGGVDSIKYTLDDLRSLSASYKSEDEQIAYRNKFAERNLYIFVLDIS